MTYMRVRKDPENDPWNRIQQVNRITSEKMTAK
jgi:hypothetical protein